MAGAGIRKHMIYDQLVSRYGSYAKAGFGRKKLYNMCYREKMKLPAQGDADTTIGIMMTRRERDPDFFFEHTVNDEGRLKNLFWCDSQSRRDYVDYSDVTVFDSTYRMNRYGMPFIPFVGLNNHRCTTVFGCALVSDETEDSYVWLLEMFLRAHCQKRPRSVITDGDAAMIKAIRKEDMKKARELEVLERLRGADTHRFILTWKENGDIRFTMDYTPGTLLEFWSIKDCFAL
ncbi:protein FAR1-RELATED SEQUENCE 5-like [Aegilops tauschii subsp. strangulata]|uniref:protein FAR1-RELATED SEQUENCE 5-like n=1 Tax=Aegilops tauschii subsp. strangulata TaxID=200361 RepID=UPI003CC8C0E3